MRRIFEITIEEVEDVNANLDEYRTILDHENERIVSSVKYTQEDVEKYGWDQIVQFVNEDAARIHDYNNFRWSYMFWKVKARIGTSMGNGKWMEHNLYSRSPNYESDRVGNSRLEHRMNAILDLYESMRLLGFTKHQFVRALPFEVQRDFRRRIVEIREDGRR